MSEPTIDEAYEELNDLLEDITLQAKSKLVAFKTANGITYKHLLRCPTSTEAPFDENTWCFLSNTRFCFCEQRKFTDSKYYLLTLYINPSTGINYVADVGTSTGSHNASLSARYPSGGPISVSTNLVYVKKVTGSPSSANWATNLDPTTLPPYNIESFPVFDTYEEALEYLTAPDGDFKVGVQDVPKVIDVYY